MYYTRTLTNVDGSTQEVIELIDGAIAVQFTKDETNRHYRKFLEWVAEGNTPEEFTEPQSEPDHPAT